MAGSNELLAGKVGLVVGIANDQSIAAGCAQPFRMAGAKLALPYREKSLPYVKRVAEAVEARLLLPLDVETGGALESVFERTRETFGRLDFALHSIVFCPKADLHGRVTDCSREGFALAMDVSVPSLHPHGATGGAADVDQARARAPERRLVTIENVGAIATGLVSDFARNVTGTIAYVDAGYHVMS